MRVQEVLLDGNKKRYLLLGKGGMPVVPVMKYLKYLDVTGKSSITLKTYFFNQKFTYKRYDYFEYKTRRESN